MSGLACPYCNGTGQLVGDHATVGARILFYRRAAEMSQQELAGKIGRSRPQIANIEGGRSDIPVSLLTSIAKALAVNASDLLP